MNLVIPVLAAAMLFSGCASSKHLMLSEQSQTELQGARLIVTKRVPPNYEDVTTTDGLVLGAVGVAGGVVGGAVFGLVNDYSTQVIGDARVQDPAVKIKDALAEQFVRGSRVQVVNNSSIAILDGKLSDSIADYSESTDYVLDVETIRWMSVYLPSNWGRYRVVYKVRCSLFDVENGELIAEATVFWKTPADYGYPTHDELFGNDAAELKKQLNLAAENAISYFTENVLP
jgi:hypothetical protein